MYLVTSQHCIYTSSSLILGHRREDKFCAHHKCSWSINILFCLTYVSAVKIFVFAAIVLERLKFVFGLY